MGSTWNGNIYREWEKGEGGQCGRTGHNKQRQDVGPESEREKEKRLLASVSVFLLKQLGKIIYGGGGEGLLSLK